MSALGVALRALMYLAGHTAVRSAFKAALRASAKELARHAIRHLQYRVSLG